MPATLTIGEIAKRADVGGIVLLGVCLAFLIEWRTVGGNTRQVGDPFTVGPGTRGAIGCSSNTAT